MYLLDRCIGYYYNGEISKININTKNRINIENARMANSALKSTCSSI